MNARSGARRYALLIGLLLIKPLAAVELSHSGHGQALVFPYYNATGEASSLLSISHGELVLPLSLSFRGDPNPQGQLAAVQISLPRADAGRHSFIVYLPEGATWSASIDMADDGTAQLSSDDPSCVFPRADGAASAEFRLEGLRATGHVEVVALGELAYTDPLAVAALPQGVFYRELVDEPGGPITRRDCAAIDASWASGSWADSPAAGWSPPSNSLSGSVQLVDLERGIGLSTTTLALVDFNRSVLHRDVRTDPVLLSEVDPPVSRVTTSEGVLQSSWSRPIDAVTAVMMAEIAIEYWQIPGLAMTTDLAITLPTFAFYNSAHPGPFIWTESVRRDDVPRLGFSFVDRSGRPHERYDLGYRAKLAKCTPPSRQDQRTSLDRGLVVLAQEPDASPDPEALPLLDFTGYEPCLDTILVEPLLDTFTGRAFSVTDADELVSIEGHRFAGVPGIVTALARSKLSLGGKSFGFQLPTTRQIRVLLPDASR